MSFLKTYVHPGKGILRQIYNIIYLAGNIAPILKYLYPGQENCVKFIIFTRWAGHIASDL